MKTGSYTDLGKVRALNEDDFYVSDYVPAHKAIYAVVADGMGGHAAGEVASSMAIHVACDYIEANFEPESGAEGVKKLLTEAVVFANNAVFSSAMSKEGLKGMGTTFTLCFVLDKKAICCHVGDSRIYRIRDEKIEKLTRDHSLVEELVKSGSITEAQAEKHPQKNVITKAIGSSPEIVPDIFETDLKEDDMLILCTDGLTNELKSDEILKLATGDDFLMAAAQKLVFAANDAGGRDNITVVLLKI